MRGEFMAVGDFLEVKLFYTGPATETMLNILHYRQGGGADTLDIGTIFTAAGVFAAIFDTARILVLSNNCKLGQIQLTLLTGANAGVQGQDTSAVGSSGSAVGAPGTIERAIVYKKLSGFIGRANRGRVFFPCPARTVFDTDGTYLPGNPDNGSINSLAAQFQQIADLTGAGINAVFFPVILNKDLVTYVSVSQVAFALRSGTQRRRRIGVGA